MPAHIGELVGLVADLAQWFARATEAGVHTAGDPRERAIRWLFGLFGTLQLAKLARFDPRLAPENVTLPLAADLLSAWALPGASS